MKYIDFHRPQEERGIKELTPCSLGLPVMNSSSAMRNFSFNNNLTVPKMIDYVQHLFTISLTIKLLSQDFKTHHC